MGSRNAGRRGRPFTQFKATPGGYNPKACLGCGLKRLFEVERRVGCARMVCLKCGGRQMAMLKDGLPVGRIEGWSGFDVHQKA